MSKEKDFKNSAFIWIFVFYSISSSIILLTLLKIKIQVKMKISFFQTFRMLIIELKLCVQS